jgi:hypothetical protein
MARQDPIGVLEREDLCPRSPDDDAFRDDHAQTRTNGIGSADGRVLQALQFTPWTVSGLATLLRLERATVAWAVLQLLCEGEVSPMRRRTGDTVRLDGETVWTTTT